MSNFPFGFSNSGDDDPDRAGKPEGLPGMPAGFDLSQLGSMLSQLGQMMSSATPTSGPVNYDLAKQLATSQVPASHPASSIDVKQVTEAVALAEIWLDGATSLPAGVRTSTAWTPKQWIEATMPMWEKLCSPIADRVSKAWLENLPEQAREQAGPLLAMMGSMGGMAFGSQLGEGLGQLAVEVLTSTDIGLPLGPEGTAALLPLAVSEFGKGLDLPEDQVRLYLAAREAAHHRLYAGVPWLKERVMSLIADFAGGISVDFSAIEDLAGTMDMSNPAGIEAALGQGMFEPKVTEAQQASLVSLETVLALLEGWVDTVVADAVGDRLPGAAALQETLRRRRATGGPAEQTFATLIGLEMRPRRLRAAADLWRALEDSRGIEARDALWSHPDLLPSSADLDDPNAFVERDKAFADMLAGIDDVDMSELDGLDETGHAAPPAASTDPEDKPKDV
ncbi:zinc-dependent metalloprotease [Nakamurella sp. PAMC28650]|uniref:zinc-dependent metalloprotease n=1 Tax=Nakamurella sp. PAMC28650 TaxID=2762325 RepID=UPI00164D1AB2|nr:zinc-dependent metalloprotease [Nakamurella sp. PAMC28650]QNK80627.1 zinc-dependent metalloprotease [Nakamurella sp. PAMC28650]